MTDKRRMVNKIEYAIAHTEWDTSYKVVRIWDVLQYIKDNDDSFKYMRDIQETQELFDLWENYWYTLNEQSMECVEFVYNLITHLLPTP